MLAEPTVLALSLAYLGLLFAVAYFGDRHARAWSASSVAPAVYGLSLAIYCTSWTFYGAVGRASTAGIDFVLIYTGPALLIVLGYPMLRKMVRLAKQHNVTSIADFLASRYGKSRAVGVTATLFATVGVLPYIALQLQAVSSTFKTIAEPTPWLDGSRGVVHTDTSLIVAALMAVFTILFGVRNVQASEQHRGMMLAIAFESVVKLLALLTLGPFVLFVLFDGPGDLLAHLARAPEVAERVTREGSPLTWAVTTLLSAMAFLCLPRQFHVAVVEHGHPASLRTARWLFPTYLLLINLFVVPIAAAGLLLLGPQVNPDLFVLQLPLTHGQSWLSAFVFIGGLSAATAMVIVACMALSGMIGNELLMPYLLRRQGRWGGRWGAGGPREMGPLVVLVRRAAVVLILMAGYAYERIISGYLPLASIGLISFCAVANFAPGVVLGLYWKRAHRYGVVAGLAGGFVVWLYALLLPTLRQSTGGGQLAPLKAYLPAPLAELDPVTRDQLEKGRWVQDASGLLYPEFRPKEHVLQSLPPDFKSTAIVGFDFGVVDSNALALVAWRDNDPVTYILKAYEFKGLAEECAVEYRSVERSHPPAKVIGDIGGLGKAIAEDMIQRFSVPVEAAQKHNKLGFIRLLNGAMKHNKIRVYGPECRDLIHQWSTLPKHKETGAEVDGFDNHAADATLYAWRESQSFAERDKETEPAINSPEFYAAIERKMKENADRWVLDQQQNTESMWDTDE
jgi:Na+/proline symporter